MSRGCHVGDPTPRAGYICNVCGAQGEHWRVNCPTIRSQGPQHFYGYQRSRKFRKARVQDGAAAVAEPTQCSAVEPLETGFAHGAWEFDELNALPMRASTLQNNVLVADLPAQQQQRIWAFVRRRCMPANPEVAVALATCARERPTALRVKELIESVEAFAVAEAFISACALRGKPTSTIAEVACGHGMVGLLLAYRFPHSRVVCCDLTRRAAFDALLAAFVAVGYALAGCDAPLSNLSFFEVGWVEWGGVE